MFNDLLPEPVVLEAETAGWTKITNTDSHMVSQVHLVSSGRSEGLFHWHPNTVVICESSSSPWNSCGGGRAFDSEDRGGGRVGGTHAESR